jgi:hypothetical protein
MDTPTSPARGRRRRLAGALLLTTGIAVGIGLAAGWIAYGAAERDDEDQWAELGRAVVAGLVAVVVGVTALVAGTVGAVRRTVEPGRRLATGATALAVITGALAAVGWLGESTTRAGVELLALPAAGLLLATGAALIGTAAGVVSRRLALGLVAGSVAALVVVGLLAEVRAGTVDRQRRAARYEATEAPLALVGGTGLDLDLDGWRLESVDDGWGYDRVTITYEVPVAGLSSTWITLVLHADPEPIACDTFTCDDLGRLSNGQPIRGRRFPGGRGGYSDVWVDVPGGRWHVSTSVEGALGPETAAVLRSLRPVDAERFAGAA